MDFQRFPIWKGEVVVGTGFVLLAILVIVEAVELGPGWGKAGPQPGFFPFSLALVMGVGSLVALVQALVRRDSSPFFEVRQEVVDVTKVGIPLAVAIGSISFLGLYIVTVLYIGLFTAWYGGFRWYASFGAGLVSAAALYLGLERGFLISMPKSMWYGTLFPF